MSDHKDWGNNDKILHDRHLKGIKSVTENEHLWIMKFLVVVLMYYHNVSENMEWMNSENLAKWTCVVRNKLEFATANCVVYSESGFRCRICVVRSEVGVRCRIVLSTTNQVFAAELCCPQRSKCSLQNCVVRSEASVRCWICVQVCCPQWTGVRCRNVLFVANPH